MPVLKKLFRRQKRRKDAEFLRFLELNYRNYADLCVYGSVIGFDESNQGVASACREWLPALSSDIHRRICESIALFHEAAADRRRSLDSLIIALDELRDESPSLVASYFGATPQQPDVVVKDPRTGRLSIVDFKTTGKAQTSSVVHETPCSYCNDAPGTPSVLLSGESASVCTAKACISKHDLRFREELKKFSGARVVSHALH